MSKKDTVSKKYLQDSKRFADLFNFYLYDGKQVIKPEQLKPLDTAEIALPYGKRTKSSTIQKQRDIIKAVTAMTDDEYTYLLLASELQSEQHYAMPIRNMLYDAIQYSDQIAQITKIHKENDDKYNDNGEYLSGFMKSDRLIPVITLTVYFGASKWGAPTSLHEMLMVKDSSILQFIPDYKINLITPASIKEKDFDKFSTELKSVLKYIKYSNDKELLKNAIDNDAAYKSISRESVEMINVITNSNIPIKKGKGPIDMCKAMEDIRTEEREEGKIEGKLITLFSLVEKNLLAPENAAAEAEMTIEKFNKEFMVYKTGKE